ncbi:hypothetical protein AWENTII_010571 [Aspergillus wentii]
MKSSIIATCKQTRFHLLDDKPAQEIDVAGLNILVSSAQPPKDASKSKGKSKAKNEGRELLVDAHLRLKSGVHYGLIGRNGTGKSSREYQSALFSWLMKASASSGDGGDAGPWYTARNEDCDLAADGF